MSDRAPFYVGYADEVPPALRPFLRRVVLLGVLLAAVAGAALVADLPAYGPGVFEFLQVRPFTGVVRTAPVPHLEVARRGVPLAGVPTASRYLLVGQGKVGADARVAEFDGRPVRLTGTLVHSDGQTLIELSDDPIEPLSGQAIRTPGGGGGSSGFFTPVEPPLSLGRLTLTGEIVDSKCFLGVMKPGRLKTHRACAIRCIAGGIPPVLVVQDDGGRVAHLVLVGADGEPVNERVLDLVADPVRVTGEVERHGDLLVLRADPATIERL